MGGLAIFLALFVLEVVSQSSNVTTCIPLYQWSINSENQTPCLVAAFLETACQEQNPAEVNSLPPNNHYTGPSVADATLCLCSTVTYSLISACGGCQDRTFISWTDWAANCSQVEVATFLQPIPSQVVVPTWAYLNVTQSNNVFNPILANVSISNPQSSSSSVMSSSTPSTPSQTSSSTAAPSSTSSVTLPTPLPASRTKSNAGAIAGGVVGGLVALVAAGLTVFFCLRRNRQEPEPIANADSSFSASMHQRSGSGQTTARSPLSLTPFPYVGGSELETETFPGSPVTSAVHTTFDANSVMTPAVQIVHRYMGSAEV